MELSEYFNENGSNIKGVCKSMKSEKEILKNQSELSRVNKRGNFILRQELKDYSPEWTIKFSIIFNLILTFIFMLFAVPILISSENVKRTEVEYDRCIIKDVKNPITKQTEKLCELEFTLNQTYSAPVHIYYKLDGYFSNNREYSKSRIWSQLRGENATQYYVDLKCDDMAYNIDAFGNDTTKLKSFTGNDLDPKEVLNPCGKIAYNYFTDNFTLFSKNEKILKHIFINETRISYEYDKTTIYKRNDLYKYLQWIDVEDEHFKVWMNMETFPTFSKKWGKIDTDLEPGKYVILVDNKWNMTHTGVGKYFVLSSSEGLGSASFFGWVLIKSAFVSCCTIVVLLVTRAIQKSKFEEDDLIWN